MVAQTANRKAAPVVETRMRPKPGQGPARVTAAPAAGEEDQYDDQNSPSATLTPERTRRSGAGQRRRIGGPPGLGRGYPHVGRETCATGVSR